MRITVTIDDDLLVAANALACLNSESLGQVLSDLARAGLAVSGPSPTTNDESFPVFRVSKNSPPITLEDVKRAEDEERSLDGPDLGAV